MWDANDEWSLRIASVDKRFSVSLPVIFPPFGRATTWPADSVPIYVSGPEFPGLNGRKDVWVRCNALGKGEVSITPACVARVLEWCLNPDKDVEEFQAPGAVG